MYMQDNLIADIYDPHLVQGVDRKPLYDLAVWKNGLAFKNIDFSDHGKPVIKIAELNNGITRGTSRTVGEYSSDVYMRKGDYAFSWSGNPQTSIDIFKYNYEDGWLNQHIFKVTPKDFIDRRFFYYLMKLHRPVFAMIASNKQTTGLGHVTIGDLKKLMVSIPDRSTQKRIAEILGSIDDKIELNKETNSNLRSLAQALYRSWFVENNQGDETTACECRLGPISEIATIVRDSYNPARHPNCVVDHFSLPSFDQGCYPSQENTNAIKSNKFEIGSQALLVSKLNPSIKRIWRPCVKSQTAIASTEFVVLEAKVPENRDWLFTVIDSDAFSEYLCANVGGTTNSHQRVSPEDVLMYRVPIPPQEVLSKFNKLVKPLYDRIEANIAESRNLASLRDTLLPKLMSGELDVDDVKVD